MPQASDELRNKWNDDGEIGDEKALKFLGKAGFVDNRGMLSHPTKKWVDFSEDEKSAIYYMINEWDYDYVGG